MKALPRVCLMSGIASAVVSAESALTMLIAFSVAQGGSSFQVWASEQQFTRASAICYTSLALCIVSLLLSLVASKRRKVR